MNSGTRRTLVKLLLGLVPSDGTPIGNQRLREQFIDAARSKGHKVPEATVESLCEELVEAGTLARGKGRGGSVHRAIAVNSDDFSLEHQAAVATDGASTPS